MVRVVSVINLKGGVAKTTTTVAVAEALASLHGMRVLIIDLDPQTNSTVLLIGETRWRELDDAGLTLANLFRVAMSPTGTPVDLASIVQRGVGDVRGCEALDLVPSSLGLIELQDRLSMAPNRFYGDSPVDVLRHAAGDLFAPYDFVFIDCPPNLGLITLNGLRLSDGVVIPTVADNLSTFGIPQILTKLETFSVEIGRVVVPYGILATKYQPGSSVHRNMLRTLRDDPEMPHVFQNVVKQSNQIAASSEYQPAKRTFRQKYGYNGLAEMFDDVAIEIANRVRKLTPRRA